MNPRTNQRPNAGKTATLQIKTPPAKQNLRMYTGKPTLRFTQKPLQIGPINPNYIA